MDPVLEVLRERHLEKVHIDRVCALFDDVEARDVHMAFDILMRLHKYRNETQSWSFRLLASHDFEGPGNKFELDLAQLVGARAHKLLGHMAEWRVPDLKAKVARLPQYNEWGIVLTSLVMRIVAQHSSVELALRMAASRATLVRIHCELSELSQEDESDGQPLIEKYRYFVLALLAELEGSPSGPAQEKMFRTVSDLNSMFSSFKQGRTGGDEPERKSIRSGRVPSAKPTPPRSGERSTYASDTASSYSASDSSRGSSTSFTSTSTEGQPSTLISAKDGLLSAKVLGAFDTARTEEKVNSIIQHKTQPRKAPEFHRKTDLPSKPEAAPKAVNVRMVDGRMMVMQDGNLVDMQEWLDRANNLKMPQMPQPNRFSRPEPPAKPNIASSSFMQALKRGW